MQEREILLMPTIHIIPDLIIYMIFGVNMNIHKVYGGIV